MDRCAYCGEKVGDEGLYVDDEVFCSDECMRDFGASASHADEDDDDYEDDDESGEEEEEEKDDDDDY